MPPPQMPLLPAPTERMNTRAANKDRHPGLIDLDRPRRSWDEVAQTRQEADEAQKIEEAHVAMAVQKAANIEDNLRYEDQQCEAKRIAEANSNRSKNTTANAEHGLSLTICGDIYISFAIDNDVQNCPQRRKRPRAMKTKKNNPRRNQPHTLMKASRKVNTCPLGSSANSLGRKPSCLHQPALKVKMTIATVSHQCMHSRPFSIDISRRKEEVQMGIQQVGGVTR
jgi:hypothetical protein